MAFSLGRHIQHKARHPSGARPILVALLTTYLALAVGYSLANPLYESTDELRHFRYVRHLIVYRSLPSQRQDGPRAQSHHPPLYYALGALVSWWVPVEQEVYYGPDENPFWAYRYWEVSADNKNQYLHGDDERFPFHGVTLAIYLVRWMTTLIGAGAVWITYRIGSEIVETVAGTPDRYALALGGASLMAFNPQFLYLSGAVNNDILATFWGAAVLWACVRLVSTAPPPIAGGPSRADLTLGLLYGLALLTKLNLLALLVPITLAYALAGWRTRNWRAYLRGYLVVLALAGLIAGWWFWRNQVLYGDPTGMTMVNELWEGRPAGSNWWAVRQSLPYLWSSLWGRFGYGQVPLPSTIYRGLLLFCGLALAGYLLPRRRPKGPSEPPGSSTPIAALLLLVSSLATSTAVVFYYIAIQPAGAMGRFLFPALPALALLLFLGLSRFAPHRMTWAMSLAVATGMAALAIYALVGVLAPAFARPRPLTDSELDAIPNPINVEFGLSTDSGHSGVARLLGYRVTPATVEPGGVMEVTLYWQALARTAQNYAIFVHLLSEVGTMVAQRDTYPGLGRYPTTTWDPGVAFADTYRLHIPETAYTPDIGHIQVGMYLPNGPRLTTPDGRDALRLEQIEIQPQPGELPNPLEVNFDNQAMLIGYKLDRRVVQPGETIHLTLYWQALVPMEADYRVFAHVLGVENQVWANSDSQPARETAPTSQWQPGQIIEDVRDLTIGLTTPPDFYDIEVGMYVAGGDRLPIVAENGHWLNDRALLSKIRVVSE